MYNAHTLKKRQSGAVLAVSLILLLIMTMIGISAMSTTTLQETFSANAQHKATSFQAAESVIKTTWAVPIMGNAIGGVNVIIAPTNAFNSINNSNGGTPITTAVNSTAAVQYCGQVIGSFKTEMNARQGASIEAEHAFDVCGQATVTLANAQSIHAQGASIIGPGSASGVNCAQVPAAVLPAC